MGGQASLLQIWGNKIAKLMQEQEAELDNTKDHVILAGCPTLHFKCLQGEELTQLLKKGLRVSGHI